jgi:hypothetical protein
VIDQAKTDICPRCNKDLTQVIAILGREDTLLMHRRAHQYQDFLDELKCIKNKLNNADTIEGAKRDLETVISSMER